MILDVLSNLNNSRITILWFYENPSSWGRREGMKQKLGTIIRPLQKAKWKIKWRERQRTACSRSPSICGYIGDEPETLWVWHKSSCRHDWPLSAGCRENLTSSGSSWRASVMSAVVIYSQYRWSSPSGFTAVGFCSRLPMSSDLTKLWEPQPTDQIRDMRGDSWWGSFFSCPRMQEQALPVTSLQLLWLFHTVL